MFAEIAAKLLAFVTQPLLWVLALLLLSQCYWQRRRLARGLGLAALGMLLLLGWQPLPDALLRHLETQYLEIAPGADLQAYAGVIVLGGALEPAAQSEAHSQPLLNDSAERMTVVPALLRRNPGLRVIFSGGEGHLLDHGASEAQRAQVFFSSQGMAAQQVVYESASRNTYENAVLTAQLPGLDRRLPWLLITSAWHMPRAMACFVHAGWNVTPYPVDFRTGQATAWTTYGFASSLERWDIALHELLGYTLYRLAGRL